MINRPLPVRRKAVEAQSIHRAFDRRSVRYPPLPFPKPAAEGLRCSAPVHASSAAVEQTTPLERDARPAEAVG